MSSTQDSDLRTFAESPMVTIIVKDTKSKMCTFYVHRSLLEDRSLLFGNRFAATDMCKPGSQPVFEFWAEHSVFRDFIWWLYHSEVPYASLLLNLRSLWFLASNWNILAFRNYLHDMCRQHFTTCDLLRLLRTMTYSPMFPLCKLATYVVKKLAFEIISKGWLSFIEASEGEWQGFVSIPQDKSRHKKEFMTRLMLELEENEDSSSAVEREDPAIKVCEWHEHCSDKERDECQRRQAAISS